MKITFCGQDIDLHHTGAAYWGDAGIAIVSDLHLEKGSHFARRGYFLPPYDSLETLQRLLSFCAEYGPRNLILLGDSFHDAGGYARLPHAARAAFDSLRAFNPVWIRGNHDGDVVPEGIASYDEYRCEGLVFRHEAAADADAGEISGHYHPKIDIVHKGSRLSRPCFIEDGRRLIMPAFGAYTGGLAVTAAPIRDRLSAPPRIYALGPQRVYALSNS